MVYAHVPIASVNLPGHLGSKALREKVVIQRGKRRKVLGVLSISLFLYMMYSMQKSFSHTVPAKRSTNTRNEGTADTLFETKKRTLNFKKVHFDVTGPDEDFLRALTTFGIKGGSCTDETSTCVGTLIMVNRGAIELYRNFLHYLAKLNLQKYDFIVCTSDEEVSSLALLNNQRVIVVNNHEIEDDRLDFGTPSYQLAMSLRTRLINILLRANMYQYWLIADTDSVWLCDPFELIFDADFSEDPFDVGGQVDFNRICGGFLVLRTNPAVQNLWNEVTSTYEETIRTSDIGTSIEKTEQGILHDLISDETRGLNVKQFSKELFPSGFDYFQDYMQEQACVIHNNYIIGIDKKIERFKEFNLWMNDGSDLDDS